MKSSNSDIINHVSIAVDNIASFIIRQKLLNKAEIHHAYINLKNSPNMHVYLCQSFMETGVLDDSSSRWSLSRAILPLILLQPQVFTIETWYMYIYILLTLDIYIHIYALLQINNMTFTNTTKLKYYEYYINTLVQGQPIYQQQTIHTVFNLNDSSLISFSWIQLISKLMEDVDDTLLLKNRDRFTQNLLNFRREVKCQGVTMIQPSILSPRFQV